MPPFEVLVVEPDPALARTLTRLLGEFRVATVTSAESALFERARRDVDLLVTATRLDGLDGIELCRVMKSHGDVPVIVTDHGPSPDDELAAFGAGADDVVDLDRQSAELPARVDALLRRRRGRLRPHRSVRVGPLVLQWREDGEFVLDGDEVTATGPALCVLEVLAECPGLVVNESTLGQRLAERPTPVAVTDALADLQRMLHDAGAPDVLQRVPEGGWRLTG